jgi:hypothetical protein
VSRRLAWILATLVAVALVAAAAVWLVIFLRGPRAADASSAECTVPAVGTASVTVVVEGPQSSGAGAAGNAAAGASATASTSVVTAGPVGLTAVQLQHASTVNAVGLARGLPDRARVIAVATAWQESGLRNLPGGDRDSVGLFQQRPSQGWGTAAELQDPVVAAGKFYDALLEVPGWQSMSLTRAAQEVQYSAFPDAYAKWEPDATTLVRGLSGSTAPALTCRAGSTAPDPITASRAALPGTTGASTRLAALLAAARAELGGITADATTATSAQLTITVKGADAEQSGRALAAWLVAHATGAGITEVVGSDGRWTTAGWASGPAQAAGTVTVTVAG